MVHKPSEEDYMFRHNLNSVVCNLLFGADDSLHPDFQLVFYYNEALVILTNKDFNESFHLSDPNMIDKMKQALNTYDKSTKVTNGRALRPINNR